MSRVSRLIRARATEAETLVALVNLGEQLAEAARWYLESGSQEAREALSGAVAAWEVDG